MRDRAQKPAKSHTRRSEAKGPRAWRQRRRIPCYEPSRSTQDWLFYGIRGQARQGTRRTRPKAHISATRMAFPVIRRRLYISYSPRCGRHCHTVRSRAETCDTPSRHRQAIARAAPPSSPAGACRRGAENTRAALACSRSGFYIHTIGVTCARALFEPHQHALCRVVPPPPSPPVFPLCGLTNNGLHRRGSRYDHFCGQLPELSRATRAHVIQWVACVPPRDLRAPFFPPHLVAHSEACAPRQSVISKVIGVSNEVWRAEGGA